MERLKKNASQFRWWIRLLPRMLADSRHVPVLWILAITSDPWIRFWVADNSNASTRLLNRLLNDAHPEVRWAAANTLEWKTGIDLTS